MRMMKMRMRMAVVIWGVYRIERGVSVRWTRTKRTEE